MNKNRMLFIIGEDVFFLSHRLSLAHYVKNKGMRVGVLCRITSGKTNELLDFFDIFPWRSRRSSLNPVSFLISSYSCYRAIKKFQPSALNVVGIKQIITVFFLTPFLLCSNISYVVSGLGFVYSTKTFKSYILRFFMLTIFARILKNSKHKVIVQNSDDFRLFSSFANANLFLIQGSGVDLEFFTPINTKPKIIQIVFPSRIVKDKGVEEFVAAAKILKKSNFKARFILVGEIDKESGRSIPLDIINTWVTQGIVEYFGYKEDMRGVYADAGIICLPSYREGLPKTLIESAACGVPAIAFDVPGCRDVIDNGINGILVEFGDVLALANAIKKLSLDPKMRSEMGSKFRKKAENFYEINKINHKIFNIFVS